MSSDEAPFGEYDSGNESPQDDDTEEDFGEFRGSQNDSRAPKRYSMRTKLIHQFCEKNWKLESIQG